MATWNSTYESIPAGYQNPGEGAFHIRDVKAEVRTRLNREHIYGPDETGDASNFLGGQHREGGAKVTVADGGSSFRDGQLATHLSQIGQIRVDMDAVTVQRTQDGVNLQDVPGFDYTDQKRKDISVVGALFAGSTGVTTAPSDPTQNEVFDVFKYDNMVDIFQDQAIDGIKTFELAARVPDIDATGSSVEDRWADFIASASTAEKQTVINILEANTNHLRAKFFNNLDADDEDNVDNLITDARSTAANGKVTNEKVEVTDLYATNLEATTITADAVYGAVYV